MEDCIECGGQAVMICKCGESVCARCFDEHIRRDGEREMARLEWLYEPKTTVGNYGRC